MAATSGRLEVCLDPPLMSKQFCEAVALHSNDMMPDFSHFATESLNEYYTGACEEPGVCIAWEGLPEVAALQQSWRAAKEVRDQVFANVDVDQSPPTLSLYSKDNIDSTSANESMVDPEIDEQTLSTYVSDVPKGRYPLTYDIEAQASLQISPNTLSRFRQWYDEMIDALNTIKLLRLSLTSSMKDIDLPISKEA